MEKKLLFIVNPYSGRAEVKNNALGIIDRFVKAGYSVTVYTTQASNDASEMIQKAGAGFDRIVCCGGDGTVNETLNGLMQLKQRPEMAMIPAGTTNDYAYSLHIPFQMLDAADVAVSDRIFNIDVGKFGDRYFTYVAAFGLFTDVTYETPQNYKNILGSVAYVLEGAKRITSIKSHHIKVEHDGGVIEDDVILGLFSNTVSVAGIRTAFEDAKLDDGLLEITLVKPPKTFLDTQAIIHLLLDFEKTTEVHSDFLKVITTSKATITCDEPISWTVDGENGGIHKTISIENCPKAIHVVVGENPSKSKNNEI